MAASTERLPGQHDTAPVQASGRSARQGTDSIWPWYLVLLLLISAVGAGAWWLSTGREAPPPELPAEESLPIPVTQDPAAANENPAESESVVPEPVSDDPLVAAAPTTSRVAGPPLASGVTTRSVSTKQPRRSPLRSVARDNNPAEVTLSTSPDPILAVNPRPYGGRVVQLGAFPTRKQAEDSWQRITRRYPYLRTRSKMVNTVDVGGLGGGRPTRMYRLQLGTSSQAQSVVICQQLERAGHSCVVVY